MSTLSDTSRKPAKRVYLGQSRRSRRLWQGARLLLGLVASLPLGVASLQGQASDNGRPRLVERAGPAHDLAPGQTHDARLHLLGTITYYDPANAIMFLQDASGGIFVNTEKTYPVHEGDLVEVDGRANASYGTEVATDARLRVLGRGERFLAPVATFQDLISGRDDCRLVTIRGKVRATDVGHHASAPAVHMDVAMPGGEIEIYVVSSTGFDPESMLDAEVEITGVAGGSFDAKWQLTGAILYVQSPSAIRITQAPLLRATRLPVTDINKVLETRSVLDQSQRVRVRGTITYYEKGYAAVLESEGKSIYVQTRQTADLAVGDVADAFGFASDNGYAPGLREAALVKTGMRAHITPRTVTYAQALSGAYSDNLISLTGRLVSELHDVGTDTMVLEVQGHLVSAYLEGAAPLPSFLPGSLIRIVGICRVLPGNPWQAPYVFHVDLRDMSDVQLVSRASWWTIHHLIGLLSGLALVAFAIATWAMILRKRVLHQSERIQRSMTIAGERTRILKMISSNEMPDAVLAEICNSVMRLLPGAACSYALHAGKTNASLPEDQGRTCPLFELPLTGPEEEILGRIVVSAARNRPFPLNEQREVYAILTELASLAIRQSLLYQGLLHHSTHDPLTELPNRRLCDSKLAEALEGARLRAGQLAVIYIDVNRFKRVNDRFGHKVGDTYLRQISARLLSQLRPDDTLARIGGDEFLVIAPSGGSAGFTEAITQRLKACFDEPFILEGEPIQGSASFGVATYPQNGRTPEELKRNADHAMYLGKRNPVGAVDASSDIAIVTPDELAAALDKGLFRLAYQPQFSSAGRLTGLEALLRLEDPILGTLAPDAFICVAERSEVIIEIGAWVLRRALEDAVHWQLQTGEPIVIAVNVSVRQIAQPAFAESVLACLSEHNFPAERLEIELVERSLLSGVEEVTRQLEQLHQAGVRISLDDFGTGQSCLTMLHKLPIHTMKLDRSFILAMDEEPEVLPIIQAICSMATSMGKRIVAEGIEHVGPVPTLLKMAEMEFQGYLLSRPVPASEVDQLIEGWRAGIHMPAAFGVARDQVDNVVISERAAQPLKS